MTMLPPFFVWHQKVLKSIRPEEVMCLATEKNYTKIYLSNDTHCMVRVTLAKALKKLPAEIFIKTHRSYAVSVYYINNISRDHLTIGPHPVPIGKQYYKSVINRLNIIG